MERQAVKPITYNSRNGGLLLAMTMLALLALSVPGCVRSTGIQVLPVGNRDVLDLTARDVVQIMRAARTPNGRRSRVRNGRLTDAPPLPGTRHRKVDRMLKASREFTHAHAPWART